MLKILSFIIMLAFSCQVQSASDSSKIVIGVTIKASHQCDYVFSLANSNKGYSHSSFCDVSGIKLQEQLNEIAYSTKVVTADNRYRVFMTVQ